MTITKVSEKYEISADTLRYYERAGMIPPVNRTPGGRRDYTAEDCSWVELAKCMRGAGLPVETMAEYRRLHEQGPATLAERHALLLAQQETLLAQRAAIDETLQRLAYKISRYEQALKTGVLEWSDPGLPESED